MTSTLAMMSSMLLEGIRGTIDSRELSCRMEEDCSKMYALDLEFSIGSMIDSFCWLLAASLAGFWIPLVCLGFGIVVE